MNQETGIPTLRTKIIHGFRVKNPVYLHCTDIYFGLLRSSRIIWSSLLGNNVDSCYLAWSRPHEKPHRWVRYDEERKTTSVGGNCISYFVAPRITYKYHYLQLITHLEVAKAAELPTTSFNKSDTSSSRGLKLLPDQVLSTGGRKICQEVRADFLWWQGWYFALKVQRSVWLAAVDTRATTVLQGGKRSKQGAGLEENDLGVT